MKNDKTKLALECMGICAIIFILVAIVVFIGRVLGVQEFMGV